MPFHTVSIILYTPFKQTWNLKFNSALLSWCFFNSDNIIEAPDQTDCIHDLKAESIQVFFDTFYQKVIRAVKSNPKRFSNPDFFFSKNNLCITLMMCFQLCHCLTSIRTKIIWIHTMKKKPTFVLSLSFLDITLTLWLKFKTKGHSIFKFKFN